jgi:putative ABC transport system permease protein
MGLKLVSGRRFNTDEFVEWSVLNAPGSKVQIPAVIVTRSMAEKLFPAGDAVGKSFYSWGDDPVRIVGVVDHLIRPSSEGGPVAREYSMMFPIRTAYSVGGNYLIRTEPGRRADVLKAAVAALKKNGPNRIVLEENTKSMEDLRNEYYRQDR